MHDADYYSKLGFKCGLEVHQRLATKEKLFCSCATRFESDKQIGKIQRVQRAVAGELGAIDRATSFEGGRQRTFIYNIFKESTCLVDVDEEPPHAINPEALEIAMLISASLGAKVPDEIQPMRKEVVDGSNPSAFQRTMQVGFGGEIEINKKKIPLPFISLEEESGGIEKTDENSVVYNLDRIGVPLIEIDSDPVIATPQEAKEIAAKIGLMLRLTNKVQRGIGTIRQDVNVSIKGGARVEIKGFQDLDTMDEVIESEIDRQLKLLEIKKELLDRKAKVGKSMELTHIFANTKARVIKDNLGKDGVVLGTALEGFEGIMGKEINQNRRLGSEISDYAKVAGVKGLIHSDEKLDSYLMSKEEVAQIQKALKLKEKDAFMLIVGPRDVCVRAMERAIFRAGYALEGIPVETRAVDSKLNITRFLRPLPRRGKNVSRNGCKAHSSR